MPIGIQKILFSDKDLNSNTIMLYEKHLITDKEKADTMNNYFIYINGNLGLKRNLIHISKPLQPIIHRFRDHDSSTHII